MTNDFATKITELTNALVLAEKGTEEYDALVKEIDWLITSHKEILKLGIALKQIEKLENLEVAGESRVDRFKRRIAVKILRMKMQKRIREANEELERKTLELLFKPKN